MIFEFKHKFSLPAIAVRHPHVLSIVEHRGILVRLLIAVQCLPGLHHGVLSQLIATGGYHVCQQFLCLVATVDLSPNCSLNGR